jgi:hypothetical protein
VSGAAPPGKERSFTTSRFITTAGLAALLAVVPVFAGTAGELLQKGIYTQQTIGDVDAAIQIYRQVIASAGSRRALAAHAQMQIVAALLQKGDPDGARREFNALVRRYSDQKEIIASIRARLEASHKTDAPLTPSKP